VIILNSKFIQVEPLIEANSIGRHLFGLPGPCSLTCYVNDEEAFFNFTPDSHAWRNNRNFLNERPGQDSNLNPQQTWSRDKNSNSFNDSRDQCYKHFTVLNYGRSSISDFIVVDVVVSASVVRRSISHCKLTDT
jgi:hypothetical protein